MKWVKNHEVLGSKPSKDKNTRYFFPYVLTLSTLVDRVTCHLSMLGGGRYWLSKKKCCLRAGRNFRLWQWRYYECSYYHVPLWSCIFLVCKWCRLYYTKISIGNPSRDFHVQVDTGSDILWVNCASCEGCPTKSDLGVWFFFQYMCHLSFFVHKMDVGSIICS